MSTLTVMILIPGCGYHTSGIKQNGSMLKFAEGQRTKAYIDSLYFPLVPQHTTMDIVYEMREELDGMTPSQVIGTMT